MGVSNSNNKKYKKEINIIYIIKDTRYIKLFGNIFVKNNKNICKMIINNKEYEIKEEYNVENYNNNILEIKLKGINKITDMRFMFYECSSLISLPDISKWNTSNITYMNYMFYKCSSLIFLPDISKWNVSNVKNMNYMFYECSSLSFLPKISKWNVYNVKSMNYMFYGCSSLVYLPNISKWNINNIKDYASMFNKCISLSYIYDFQVNLFKNYYLCINCLNNKSKNNNFINYLYF